MPGPAAGLERDMGAGGALVTVIPLTRERKWREKVAPGGIAASDALRRA
jgi:hypothetical protein